MRKIAEAETYLISVQSGEADGDTSVHAPENDFNTVVEQLNKLNDEYAGFIAGYGKK